MRAAEVLFVDDDLLLLKSFRRQYRQFNLHAVATSEQALAVATTCRLDFAVVDVGLVDEIGIALVRKLRSVQTHLGIASASALWDVFGQDLKPAAIEAGADHVVDKDTGFDLAHVVAVLQTIIARRADQASHMAVARSRALADWIHVRAVYEACGRNKSETARRLNVSYPTVSNLLRTDRPAR
jgi:two-component system, response regulator RegA